MADTPLINLTFEVTQLAGERLEEALRVFEIMLADGFTDDGDRRPGADCYGIFALDADGKTQGVAILTDINHAAHAWLWLLYVEPHARRQGLGGKLLDLGVRVAWHLWQKPTGFGTQGFNRPMKSLAARAGFEVESIFYAPKGPKLTCDREGILDLLPSGAPKQADRPSGPMRGPVRSEGEADSVRTKP